MILFNLGRSMISSRSYCKYLSSMRIPKKYNNFNNNVKPILAPSVLDNSCLRVPFAADMSDLERRHVRVRIENPCASSFRIQARKFNSAADGKKVDLVNVYQSFADACRSEGGLISSDVEFQFDTSSCGEASTNSEKYKVKITRWGDEPELPFFSSDISKLWNESSSDCIVTPQDSLSLRIVDRVMNSLLDDLVVELLGAPGIGKTCVMQQYLIHLLRHMGQKYSSPEDPSDCRRYSSEVFLRTSEKQAFRFYLEEEKTGEEVVKVERVEGDIEKLCDMFRARTRAAENRGEVLPTLLLELDDDESNPNVFGRVLDTSSVEDVDEKFKTLEKSWPYVRALMEPLSEGMMMAVVRGLVTHSQHRDNDPFLSQFVDKDGQEIEGKICEVVRKRFFKVSGFMRDLLCSDNRHTHALQRTQTQAKYPVWDEMIRISASNIPAEIQYLVMCVNNIDPTLLGDFSSFEYTFRSGLAVQELCSNISTDRDVEGLRATHMFPKAIELAWVYAALLDNKTLGCTPPATWDKENMQFFSDPGHHKLDSQKHELCGDMVPVFPLCTRVVNGFGNTVCQDSEGQSIRDFAQGVLYMGRSSHTKICRYFTVCHTTKTVFAFRTSSLKPTHRLSAIDETDLQAVMRDIGMFEGEGRKYKFQLVYVVDGATSLTNTTGWTVKNKDDKKFKICDLAQLSPEHFSFPPADGRKKRGEDRVHGVIVRFQPWGFIVEPPIVALMSIIDNLTMADFDDLVKRDLPYFFWDRPVGLFVGVAKLRKSLKDHLNAHDMSGSKSLC